MIFSGKAIIGFGALLGLGIALLGSADVLAFFLFGSPIPATREFSETMLAIIIFSSMPRAFSLNRHVSVDLFIGRSDGPMARIQKVATALVGLFVFGLLAWNGANMAIISTASNELAVSTIRFPVWPIKILVAASMIVTLAEFLRQVINLFLPIPMEPGPQTVVGSTSDTNGS